MRFAALSIAKGFDNEDFNTDVLEEIAKVCLWSQSHIICWLVSRSIVDYFHGRTQIYVLMANLFIEAKRFMNEQREMITGYRYFLERRSLHAISVNN